MRCLFRPHTRQNNGLELVPGTSRSRFREERICEKAMGIGPRSSAETSERNKICLLTLPGLRPLQSLILPWGHNGLPFSSGRQSLPMGMQQLFLVTMGTLSAWQPGSHSESQERVEGWKWWEVVLWRRGGGSSPPSCWGGKRGRKDAQLAERPQGEAPDPRKTHFVIQFRGLGVGLYAKLDPGARPLDVFLY